MQANTFLAPFNHAYAAIDPETYRILSASDLLRQIAHLEVRTTTDGKGQTWSGIYILGDSTYFELLRNDSLDGLRPDVSGFAVSPEKTGSISECIRRLGDTGSDVVYRAVRRQESPASIPWFYMAIPENFPEKGDFQFWCMQYQPAFLGTWKPELFPKEGTGRRNVLDKYRADLTLKGRPALSDVVALSLNLEPAPRASLMTYLSALGWTVVGTSNIEGPDGFVIQLLSEEAGRHGLRAITLRAEGLAPQRVELGAITLVIHENKVVLKW